MSKPSLARGTRDFGPEVMAKRNFIIGNIKSVFQKFGFLPLETPAIENLSVLMGKYGEEGDQLLFKILNSGDYAKDLTKEDLDKGSKEMIGKISEKGLKYDLTVPFARYVVMNRHELAMPFKRFQVQPVWRADRPQKGRYREFYQCDADVVGTDSLLCEAEIVLMINEVFEKLQLRDFTIKVNNRKILSGIAEKIGRQGAESVLCVAIDKLDKIGKEKVTEELLNNHFSAENIDLLEPLFTVPTDPKEAIPYLRNWLGDVEIAQKGIEELQEMLDLLALNGAEKDFHVSIDTTLARGLSYYTGAIFEVKANGVQMGSISGGGRYDNLTGTFGLPGLSGVGISFGLDRIFDVLEELELFPESTKISTQLLLVSFDESTFKACIPVLAHLREKEISAEIYPEPAKIKKQFDYANKKAIPYVLVMGENEMKSGQYTLKNMLTGEQNAFTINQITELLHAS